MSKKIATALIGGNWKCNGTVAQIKTMVGALNAAGPFSAKSEVVIAVPAIHLAAAKATIRSDIAIAAEDVCFKKGYGAFTGKLTVTISNGQFTSNMV